jgi:hypothetical protein
MVEAVDAIAGGEEEVRAREWEEADEKACEEEGRGNEDGSPCLKRMLWGEVDEMETYWEDVFII